MMKIRLVDSGWENEFMEALKAHCDELRIVCPFIKRRTAQRLIKFGTPKKIQVITRFNLGNFDEGVSDLSALKFLLKSGAQIKGVKNLHSKLYLFGKSRAIVTSANLTESALLKNHEFGLVALSGSVVNECVKYFNDLWGRSGEELTLDRLEKWEEKLTLHQATGSRPSNRRGLGDEGVAVGFEDPPLALLTSISDAAQAFVKFFGKSSARALYNMLVIEEVDRSGCHWACTYPKGKRPRQVEDGDLMFMGRMMKDPDDIIIYGRAIGLKHVENRDDASLEDIKLRDWKTDWPHYIRVHQAEFIGGILANGISLNELMKELGYNSFASTQRNALDGQGNINPRKSYMQKAAIKLTQLSTNWVNKRLEQAFEEYGKITPSELEKLDWPSIDYFSN